MLVTDALQEMRYAAFEAADAATGLAILQSDKRIDLLITDVGLPGMNGRQLADAAHVRRPALKVLFITGYAENAIIGNGQLAPGMQLLTKPFAMETLGRRIGEIIKDAG
jgi:DNA-binding response OmpR family regulator